MVIISLRNEVSSGSDPTNPHGVSARAGWRNQYHLAGGFGDQVAGRTHAYQQCDSCLLLTGRATHGKSGTHGSPWPVCPVEDFKFGFIDFRDIFPLKVVPYFIIGQTYFRVIDYLEAHRCAEAQFGEIPPREQRGLGGSSGFLPRDL